MGQLGNEPRIAQMMIQYRNEMERRKMPNTWPHSDLYHYGALFCDGQAMSMLVHAPIDAHRKVYSVGAYTLPTWRRLGLYDFIWRLCVNEWRKDGIYDVFQSGFHNDNDISRQMQAKQGRVIYEEKNNHQRTRFSLRPTGEEFDITADHLLPMVDLFTRLSG